ncbi:hypothetical protein GCM10010307_22260 [Streptomyces vastus]|uniref:Uncharacterized protein n=1 Tax=Streptomyces vastus TaxID=285451 RepID=A0ABP6D098_9ACTN
MGSGEPRERPGGIAHLSKISVSKGQTVKARQEIGLSGATATCPARTCTSKPAQDPRTDPT